MQIVNDSDEVFVFAQQLIRKMITSPRVSAWRRRRREQATKGGDSSASCHNVLR